MTLAGVLFASVVSARGQAPPPESQNQTQHESVIAQVFAHRRSRVLTCTLTNNVVVHLRRSDSSAARDPSPAPEAPAPATVTVTVAINGSELWEDPTNRGVSLFAAAWLDSDYAAQHKLPADVPSPLAPSGLVLAQVESGRLAGRVAQEDSSQSLRLECDAPPPVSVDAAALQDALLVRITGTPEQVRGGLDWLVSRLERFAGPSELADEPDASNDPTTPTPDVRACSSITPQWVEAQRERLIGSLASTRAVRSGALSTSILRAMCVEPDVRLMPPTPQMLGAITPDQVASWLQRHVSGGGEGVSDAHGSRAVGADGVDSSGGLGRGNLGASTRTVGLIGDDNADAQASRHDAQRAATIEASICGDIDLGEAMTLISHTLGRLPPRLPPSARTDEPLRAVPLREAFAHADAAIPSLLVQRATRNSGKGVDLGDVPMSSSACLVLVGFAGTDIAATEDHRTLRAVCAVLTRRADAMLVERGLLPAGGAVGVGTEAAAAPPISAGFTPTPALAYPSIGLVSATVSVSPQRSEAARSALLGAIDDLATRPPSLEELAEASATLARQAEEFERDDRAWSVLLARSRSRGLDPDSLADGAAFYRALTPAAVAGALARFASPERRFSVRLCPERPGAAGR